MKAQKVAAQFAAYVWFENQRSNASEEVKTQFSKANWKTFLPVAHDGLGQLLLKIAAGRSHRQKRKQRIEQMAMAAC